MRDESSARLRSCFLLMTVLLLLLSAILASLGGQSLQNEAFFNSAGNYMYDAFELMKMSENGNPYLYGVAAEDATYSPGCYLPMTYVLFYGMSALCPPGQNGSNDLVARTVVNLYVTFSALTLFIGLCLMQRNAPYASMGARIAPCAALMVTGAFIYAFERANTVMLAVACSCLFLTYYHSENTVSREFAYLALACAAALKIYPALLGVLLLWEKGADRWKRVARLMFYGLAACFLPFALLKGGFHNVPLWLNTLKGFSSQSAELLVPRFGFRLPAACLLHTDWASMLLNNNAWKLGRAMMEWMPWIEGALIAVILLALPKEDSMWRRVCGLTLVMLHLPAVSFAYTSLYLFPVLLLMLQQRESGTWEWVFFVLIMIVWNPVQIGIPYQALGILTRYAHLNLTNLLANAAGGIMLLLTATRSVRLIGGEVRRRRTVSRRTTLPA